MADSKRGGRSGDDEFEDSELGFDEADELADADFGADEPDADDVGSDGAATRGRGTRPVKARTASAPARPKKRAGERVSLVGRLVHFVREVVAELQKVIYPTRKELITYTSVVLVFVVVVMTVVSLLDLGFAKLMFLVFGDTTTT